MKKIFCRFLSMIIMLVMVFDFFMPHCALAVNVLEILTEPAPNTVPATQCLQTMEFLSDCLERRSIPDSADGLQQLWNDKEAVSRALSIVLYKAVYSEKRASSDTTFTAPGLRRPTITLKDYVYRFLRYGTHQGEISQSIVILILVYLDQLRKDNPDTLFIDKWNAHRLFATSYMISMKFYEDKFYDNIYMASIAGVPPSELVFMERMFLARTGFSLFFSQEHIDRYKALFENLLKKVPCLEWKSDDK